jgi:hypothetical protein
MGVHDLHCSVNYTIKYGKITNISTLAINSWHKGNAGIIINVKFIQIQKHAVNIVIVMKDMICCGLNLIVLIEMVEMCGKVSCCKFCKWQETL